MRMQSPPIYLPIYLRCKECGSQSSRVDCETQPESFWCPNCRAQTVHPKKHRGGKQP